VIQPNLFPRLENLTELIVDRREEGENLVPVPAASVRPLLLAYQDQLTELFLDCFVLRGDPWESTLFPNLNKLSVYFMYNYQPPPAQIYNNLKELDCPQLKTLKLDGEVVLTSEAFLVFNTFRDSLVELYVDIRAGSENIYPVDLLALQQLPKLVRLTLMVQDVDTSNGLWLIFRIQFPNLQSRFEFHKK